MQDLFELWVANAELLAPNRSHAIDGSIVESVAKSVAADHSSRAHNYKTFWADRWIGHRRIQRRLVCSCHKFSRFSIQRSHSQDSFLNLPTKTATVVAM